jgi:hypothetical protein
VGISPSLARTGTVSTENADRLPHYSLGTHSRHSLEHLHDPPMGDTLSLRCLPLAIHYRRFVPPVNSVRRLLVFWRCPVLPTGFLAPDYRWFVLVEDSYPEPISQPTLFAFS